MSPTLNFRTFVVYVLLCSLCLSGVFTITTVQSRASNNSLRHSLTPTVKESAAETGPQAKTADEAKRARASQAYSKRPLSFEENRGQADRHVKYISRGAGYKLSLAETEVVLTLRRSDGKQATTTAAGAQSSQPAPPHRTRSGIVRIKLSGANNAPAITGESKMAVRTNRPRGNASQKRPTDIAHYKRVRYAQVYSGVDVVYSGQQRQLEYRFEVAPFADASQIALEFGGVHRATVERQTGELVLEAVGGEVRQRQPVAYQEVGGVRREVASSYAALNKNGVRIEVGEYDRTKPLVINSVLSYATYLRDTGQDSGTTASSDFQTPDQSQKGQPVTKPAGSGYYSISGYVTDDYGYGVEGIFMSLDGTVSDYAYTDYDGYYSFDGLPAGGDYTVYPLDDNYSFDPGEYDFSGLQEDEEADFTAHSTSGTSISGTITNSADGAGVPGVTVTLRCDQYPGEECIDTLTTTTAFDGTYSFTGVPTPIHFLTIKPTKPNYRFDPSNQFLFFVPDFDITDIDFTATPKTYAIIGVVRLGEVRVPSVTMTLTSPDQPDFAPRTTTTTTGGAYAFNGLSAGHKYTVTPMPGDYQFTPASRSLFLLSANQTRLDFAIKAYSIAGRITRRGTTIGIGEVTLSLSSPTPAGFALRKLRTDSTGKYTFTALPAGRNYTLKPVKTGFTFSPVTRSITNLSGNVGAGTATNFTGAGP